MRSAAMGDQTAFTQLIDQYRQTMYATAMAVTRREEDALDAIGETILTLWEKLDTLRNPSLFKSWMTRILVNNCCNLLRGRKREIFSEEPEQWEEQGREPDLDVSLDVRETLKRLGAEDRLILQLYYFEDMSVGEIARALSLAPPTVRMRLTRGRRRFQKQYEKEADYEEK